MRPCAGLPALVLLVSVAGCSALDPPRPTATPTASAGPVTGPDAAAPSGGTGSTPCVVGEDLVGAAFGLGTAGGRRDASTCVYEGLDARPGSPSNSEYVVEASLQRLPDLTPAEIGADPALLPATPVAVGLYQDTLVLTPAEQYGSDGSVGAVPGDTCTIAVQVFLGADGATWVTTVCVHPEAGLDDDATVGGTSTVFDRVHAAVG